MESVPIALSSATTGSSTWSAAGSLTLRNRLARANMPNSKTSSRIVRVAASAGRLTTSNQPPTTRKAATPSSSPYSCLRDWACAITAMAST